MQPFNHSTSALPLKIRVYLSLLLSVLTVPLHASSNDLAWPALTSQTRPWAYWWWMGSAVDKTNLTRELQRYHDAGMGGVHIIPIYGAKGFEDRYIPYLSPAWMEMLRHTVTEAARLGMGVDMTTGSGWCFGGPNVREDEANAAVQITPTNVAAGAKVSVPVIRGRNNRTSPRGPVQAVVAFSADGKPQDVTSRLRPDGTLDWTPSSPCTVFFVSQRPSGQQVKRPAPGGEGHMLNMFYPSGMAHFLERFTEAFATYTGPKPRAMYHDSYEYRSDWAPDFFAQFEKRRGYRLQDELPAFTSDLGERTARIKCDYRETISDLMAEETTPMWVNWSHQHGFITRNEAHGAPANLLDLYAVADVPETEMFNKDRNKLVSKFASSAAHVAGHQLVGCETGTWLNEHFHETLAELKYLADDLFVSGVNHIFYHGTCYSPDEAGWPGWVFYAATEMNPRNSIWHDVPALNAYIARCQSVLQSGAPDNDILLYWPIHDFWQNPAGMAPHMTVHARAWMEQQPIGKAAEQLWNRGFTFDYISDRQLAAARVESGKVRTPGGGYRAIVVPRCTAMPLSTLNNLIALAKNGGTVIFEEQLPADVPGLAKLEARRAGLKQLLAALPIQNGEARLGTGHIIVGPLDASLGRTEIPREPMVDHPGLWFIRRSFEGGRQYFIANRGEKAVDGWVELAGSFGSAALLDPLTGNAGYARLGDRARTGTRIALQLLPGESIIVRTFTSGGTSMPAWPYAQGKGQPVNVAGRWNVEFISGGPALPQPCTMEKPGSWSQLADPEAQRFAGTARYSIQFDAPAGLDGNAWLDLGQVCQSARVRLNGRDLGTLIIPPFRTRVSGLKEKGNTLEVEVTNISANRIRDLDRRGVKWRNFNDINFVNMDYKPFDASKWPLADSGLLGPVTLIQSSEQTQRR